MKDIAACSLAIFLTLPFAAGAQSPQQAGTLTIAGQDDQAPVVRIRGKSYVDIESLARITHGSVRYHGTQIILALPQAATASGSAPVAQASKMPQLSRAFLGAEVETLTAIREWHAALVNAVQTNSPVTEDWISRFRRAADTKLQLATTATTTDPDQKALELLRNEFTNMQQLSGQFVTQHAQVDYIDPNSFANNPLDQKILTCSRALGSMAATKEFQDEPSCH